MQPNWYAKSGLSLLLLLLAAVRFINFDGAKEKMDGLSVALLLSAFILWFVPWEQLKSFKAGGVEILLQQPEVQAAVSGLGLDKIADQELRKSLTEMGPKLQLVRGSKVLWIDDKPYPLLGGRRLFRALGVNVISATSSEVAEAILQADNDFDLLITDVQRTGHSHKDVPNSIEIHEGVNFVIKLRDNTDPNIRNIPVVFFAAYPWEKLVRFTRPVRELLPEPEISNTVNDFVPKVIKRLAEERSKPINYSGPKKGTRAHSAV